MLAAGTQWNAALIQQLFTSKNAAEILSLPISQVEARDRLVWQHTKEGIYSVVSAYQWLSKIGSSSPHPLERSNNQAVIQQMWRCLWSMKIKGMLKHFIWQAYHHILPTNDKLMGKGIHVEVRCKTCEESTKTL